MQLRILALCVLVASATLVAAQTPALAGGSMLFCSGLPCVDATLAGGQHLKLLIDTGDEQSVIDLATAKKLGLAVGDSVALQK